MKRIFEGTVVVPLLTNNTGEIMIRYPNWFTSGGFIFSASPSLANWHRTGKIKGHNGQAKSAV